MACKSLGFRYIRNMSKRVIIKKYLTHCMCCSLEKKFLTNEIKTMFICFGKEKPCFFGTPFLYGEVDETIYTGEIRWIKKKSKKA